MKVKTLAQALGATLGAAIVTLAMTAGPAAADPTTPGDYGQLAGVGSDTTQDVLNGLASSITANGGGRVIASYDARGNATIKTKANNCSFPSPNGSDYGRDALRASEGENGGRYYTAPVEGDGVIPSYYVAGCIDFARSDTGPSTAIPTGSYTYISFGVDAVSYAVNANSDLPINLTLVQLQRIYRCLTTQISGVTVTPLLIQSGSGTRSFWNTKMGIHESEIAAGDYPCLNDLNNRVQEHNGRVLNGQPNYLVPFSIPQYIAQGNAGKTIGGVQVNIEDRRGEAVLGQINGVAPQTGAGGFTGDLNLNFPVTRDVYNVVPTAKLSNATVASTFVGANSQVCARADIIRAYGFGFRASTGSRPSDLTKQGCGDTYLKANS